MYSDYNFSFKTIRKTLADYQRLKERKFHKFDEEIRDLLLDFNAAVKLSLTKEQAKTLKLRYGEHLSVKEAAEELNLNPKTVTHNENGAIKRLEKAFTRWDGNAIEKGEELIKLEPKKVKVYFAHPFQGSKDNVTELERIVRSVVTKNNENCEIVPVSPLHALGFLWEDVSYEYGLELCLELLNDCDVLALCGDWKSSYGCNVEYEFAKRHGITIVELSTKELLTEGLTSGTGS